VELYLQSPNTPSWRGAQLKAQGQLYLYQPNITVLHEAQVHQFYEKKGVFYRNFVNDAYFRSD
jgi:hypothetical protein